MSQSIKLTAYSHGGGCGCKISPSTLQRIIQKEQSEKAFPQLIIGNETNDDAAVFALDDETYIISTTDFFMPIVDDPIAFGEIAAANAISDVYAMGGTPFMAVAILGWPIKKLPAQVAKQVLKGGRSACKKAGIPLAGGHSIDSLEPIFGLAVTGRVKKDCLKKNSTAQPGSHLYLTKPLGTGIITTAQKVGLAKDKHLDTVINSMLTLNKVGEVFGEIEYVNAMTDVTGYGLLGHLIEMCEASDVSAVVDSKAVPVFEFLHEYIIKQTIPGGTNRNLESYAAKVSGLTGANRLILADPQTSGGLLLSVNSQFQQQFETQCMEMGMPLFPIGKLVERKKATVIVT